jgi:rubrerythrin
MAVSEATAIPPIEPGNSIVDEEKVEKVEKSAQKLTKVEKPDDEKFKKDLAEADKTLAAVNEKLVCDSCPFP